MYVLVFVRMCVCVCVCVCVLSCVWVWQDTMECNSTGEERCAVWRETMRKIGA